LNGKEIYSGPTTGQVSSRSSNINGVEYAAVYDGDKLLWESAPGAAQQLQSQPGGGLGLDPQQFAAQHRQAFERMVQSQQQFMQAHGGAMLSTNLSVGGNGSRSLSGGSSSSGTIGSSTALPGPAQVRSSSGGIGGRGITWKTPQPTAAIAAEDSAVNIKLEKGSTVIVHQGKEYSVGPRKGNLTTKTKIVRGENFAAAFEDDQVIWENVPGAAAEVK
jgi:hypothetical protein